MSEIYFHESKKLLSRGGSTPLYLYIYAFIFPRPMDPGRNEEGGVTGNGNIWIT